MAKPICQPIHRAYLAKRIPLWVPPEEIQHSLKSQRYANEIVAELSEWIARRNSMSFAAGYLGRKAPCVNSEDIQRQLRKMKYSERRIAEITPMIVDLSDALYRKGCSRRGMIMYN